MEQQQQSKQDGLLTHTLDRLWMTTRAVRSGGGGGGGTVSEKAADKWCLGRVALDRSGRGVVGGVGWLEVACRQPYDA